jgi:uncharacterized membrane-anchored protein YjiN (DUF445 family)
MADAQHPAGDFRNLSAFVKEKFPTPHTLVDLIRQHDPSRYVADWLTDPANARRLGSYLARATQGALRLVDDARIEQLMRDAAREVFKGVDLTGALRGVLDTLTSEGRHEQLPEQTTTRWAPGQGLRQARDGGLDRRARPSTRSVRTARTRSVRARRPV